MTPQFLMAAFLSGLVILAAFSCANKAKTPAEAIGGFLGITARYATIAIIAYYGGFWK